MTEIYLVCENVDLGYHVVAAYKTEKQATDVASALNKQYEDKQRKALMSMPNNAYSLEAANQWLANRSQEYFVEMCKLNN